jgi:hypothetical protein
MKQVSIVDGEVHIFQPPQCVGIAAWTTQDEDALRHLSECGEPQWIAEVATRALARIAALSRETTDAPREGRSHGTR